MQHGVTTLKIHKHSANESPWSIVKAIKEEKGEEQEEKEEEKKVKSGEKKMYNLQT